MPAVAKAGAVVLFSGGLDSILAARLIADQGLEVTCLHFVSPFFGRPDMIARWQSLYGLNIKQVDVGDEYAQMLAERPVYGFGSVLNPCIDCKILMLRRAERIMREQGACCVISGEVLGQRPMSQRRDALHIIIRDANLKGRLVRPLCARHLEPSEPELTGIIDRSRLLDITGRGRKRQLELAREYGFKEIPAPAGGCRLTEKENARSYWPVLKHIENARAADFHLANTGRQFWFFAHGEPPCWLLVGRNQGDNDSLMRLAGPDDLLFKTRDFPGPVALGRNAVKCWKRETVTMAAAFTASYSGRAARHAVQSGEPTAVRVHPASLDEVGETVVVMPERLDLWREYVWEKAKEEIKAETRQK